MLPHDVPVRRGWYSGSGGSGDDMPTGLDSFPEALQRDILIALGGAP